MEFGEEPRLADPGLADNTGRLAAAALNLAQKVIQDREFALAVDKNGRATRRELAGSAEGVRP